jgi:hypothetical protein
MPILERILLGLTVCAQALLVGRMVYDRLYVVYRWFFILVVFQSLRHVLVLPLGVRQNTYAYIWAVTESAVWIFYVFVTLELYSMVLRDYPGIARLGRGVVLGSLVLATMGSAALLAFRAEDWRFPVLTYINTGRRAFGFSLVFFLILMLLFMRLYPLTLRRNVALHSILFTTYFTAASFGLLLQAVTGQRITRSLSVFLMVVDWLCLIAWITFFKRAGEQRVTRSRAQMTPEEYARLRDQLDTLNSTVVPSSLKD